MCIIVKKDAGTAIDYKMLNNCFDRNSDGAGFMFVSDRGVEIYKGYMKFKTFKRAVKRLCNDDMEIVFHFRISTGVLTNNGNTHPFPVCDSFELYQATHSIVETAMCHNGIMSQYEKRDNYSDTQHFVHDFLYPLKACGADLFDEKLIPAIKGVIGSTNKLAIMDKNKGVLLIGNFVTDKKYEGYTFSNTSYEGISYWKSAKNTWNNFADGFKPFNYINKYENGKLVEDTSKLSMYGEYDDYEDYEDDWYGYGVVKEGYVSDCDIYGNYLRRYHNEDMMMSELSLYDVQAPDGLHTKFVREYFRKQGTVYYDYLEDMFVLRDGTTLYYADGALIEDFAEQYRTECDNVPTGLTYSA